MDGRNFYIDLVFYNYILKCFVLFDLKMDDLTHQNIGQMQMYVNYYTRELMNEGDNPPYQEETESESTRKAPVYNSFMDEAYKVADMVELITPARFLFNAGQTPKAWNQKMLEDPHFKVLDYEQDASKIFSNTDLPEVHSRVQ